MIAIVRRRWYLMVGLLAMAGAAAPAAAAYPRPGITELVSVASDGTQADTASGPADVSSDGRFVVFMSLATNLVADDTNGRTDVFVRDRKTGATERVSLAPEGTQVFQADLASISDDGRYVAFRAGECANPGSVTCQAFVRDRAAGTTELVSVGTGGALPDGRSGFGSVDISGDGRFVAFDSVATNLVAGDTNGAEDVFVHDRETGSTERVSVASDGSQGQGQGQGAEGARCTPRAISGGGGVVAFECGFDNLVAGDTNDFIDMFVRDRQAETTERVSVRSDGTDLPIGAYVAGANAPLSDDGRFVAFTVAGGHMSTTYGGTTFQAVYVRDRATGTTERVSVRSDGTELPVAGGAAVSGDGRYVAFSCWERSPTPANLVLSQPFVLCLHDRATGTTENSAPTSDGTAPKANVGWGSASISPDGRYVAFGGNGDNLVEGDTNGMGDAFIRDRGPAAGIGGLTIQRGAAQHGVTGWATFSGVSVATAEDSPTDGDDAAGAEVTGASIIHRPETEDLLIRIDVASLPVTEIPRSPNEEEVCLGPKTGIPPLASLENCGSESYAGAPGTLYRLRFHFAQTAYEVRVLPADPTAPLQPAPARAALYECTPDCAETATLAGAVGTTGPQALVSLPLDVLGIDGPADLTQLEASVTPPGPSDPADTLIPPEPGPPADALALPDAPIEPPQVKLGVAPPQTPEGQVPLTTTADLTDGQFSATLDTSALVGPQRLLARACLVDGCGLGAFDLGAFEAAPANQSPPLIDGGAAVGSVVSCNSGEWSAYPAAAFAYQWLRDGAVIAGATGGSYPLVDADAATAIACRVTATNSRGSAQATSAPVHVPAVAPSAGSAVVEGSAAVGSVLSCAPSGFGGAPAPSYSYQWRRDGQAIAGATSDTYTVTEGDSGHTLTCLVTATNAGGSADATSAARAIAATPAGAGDETSTGGTDDTSASTQSAAQPAPADQPPDANVDSPFGASRPLEIEVRRGALRGARARKLRTLRLQLVSSEPLTRLTASLTKGKRKYGRGRLAKMARSRMLTVRLTRPLRRGTYRLRLAARRPDGSSGRVTVRIVVR